MTDLRTQVTFRCAAFNTAETKPHFNNPYNYGDDLARWLAAELQRRGTPVGEEVGQEDFGWYLSYQVNGVPYQFVLGYREDEDAGWLGWVEREAGFLGSILGARKRGIAPEAVLAIHMALTDADTVSDVRWYRERELMYGEEQGAPTPTG